jgi:hypothetical protein
MSIYTDLNVIDDFEEKYGFSATLASARGFMIAYLRLMTKALPELTQRNIKVAEQYAIGASALDDLRHEAEALWRYLKQRDAVVDYTTPVNAIVHAAFGPLTEKENLKPGELISERVSNFLDCANAFEDHSDSARTLLNEYFPLTPGR